MRCCSRTIWNNFHTELRSRVTLQFSGQSDDEVEVDYSKNCVVGWRIEINLSVLGGTRLCRKLHSRPHYYNDRPHMSDSQALVRHGPGIISQSSPCQGSCASPRNLSRVLCIPSQSCQGSCASPHSPATQWSDGAQIPVCAFLLSQSFSSLLFVWSPLCCQKIDYFTFVSCYIRHSSISFLAKTKQDNKANLGHFTSNLLLVSAQ